MEHKGVFEEDWPDDVEVASVCHAIHGFLSNAPAQDHFSYRQLREAVGSNSDRALAKALVYLSNPRLRLIKLVYFVATGDDVEEVQPDDQGDLRDPVSGELLDYTKVFTGFEAGEYYSEGRAS